MIDYDDLKELEDPSDVRDIKDRVDAKVQEIKKDLQDILLYLFLKIICIKGTSDAYKSITLYFILIVLFISLSL